MTTKAKVTCLKCRKLFTSIDPKVNRICRKCAVDNERFAVRTSKIIHTRAKFISEEEPNA